MMMGYGWGMSGGGWIAMVIFWIVLLALIVWMVTRTFGSGGQDQRARPGGDPSGQETPDQVLDRRYAAGEIDEPTYHHMRETLRSAGSQHPSQT